MSAHERERLSAYLDGELSPAERAEVEAHLATCEECSAFVARMGALDDVLRELPVEAPSGYFDSFSGRVRARLEREAPSRPRRGATRPGWRLPAWTWAAAAALVLAVLTPLTWPGLFRARVSREGPRAATPMEEPTAAESASERDVVATANEAQAAPPPLRRDAERAPKAAAAPESGFAPPPAAPPPPQPRARPGRTEVARGAAPPSGEDRPRELKKDVAVPPAGAAGAERREEAAPPAEPEAEQRQQVAAQAMTSRAEPARPGAALAVRGARAPSPESAETRREGVAVAEGKAVREEEAVAFARLAGGVPEDAAAWRERREAWRDFVANHPGGSHVDEARVRVIEAGLEAWRAGGDPEDLARARADAETYLARDDARLKARVRRALEEAETR